MIRYRNIAALLMVAAAATGCKGVKLNANRSLYSENQPVVERTDYAVDLTTTANGVPATELGRLIGWFDALQLRYGDRVSIDDPIGNEEARADIARALADYGLLLSSETPVTTGTVAPGSVRVVVTRSTASVPGCPNWRQSKLIGGQISTDSNYGCAINSNLAAMIANPEDLVLGKEGSVSPDPMTSSKAIKTYRDAKPTGAGGIEKISTSGGK